MSLQTKTKSIGQCLRDEFAPVMPMDSRLSAALNLTSEKVENAVDDRGRAAPKLSTLQRPTGFLTV